MGWTYERFEYVSAAGRRTVIPSSGWDRNREIIQGSIDPEKGTEILFVGSRQELKKRWELIAISSCLAVSEEQVARTTEFVVRVPSVPRAAITFTRLDTWPSVRKSLSAQNI